VWCFTTDPDQRWAYCDPLRNDEVCSGAEQNTDLYVKTEITGLNKSALSNRVPEELCNDIPKIEEVQHCNVFHCDLQCRLDSGRTACALYENDPRRRSSMIGVRRMTCEMHGCCFLANPVVANETTGAGLYTKEKECYQQPLTNYPEWFSLPFDSCSRDCHDGDSANVIDKNAPDAEVYPVRYRENICVYTNGSVASDILCGEPPVNSATCNMYEYCTETGCGTSGCGDNGRVLFTN